MTYLPASMGKVKVVRWTLAVVALALSATMLVGGVIGRYVHTELLDTDSFVAATAPLASDPAVQMIVADQVTTTIAGHLNSESLETQVSSVLKKFGLPAGAASMIGPLADYAISFVRPYVERFLASPAFAELWAGLVRLAHTDVVNILTGTTTPGSAVTVAGNAVQLDIGPVITAVKTGLVNDGYTVANSVPDVATQLTVLRSDKVITAQRYGRWFNRYANWFPIAGVVLLAIGLVLVPRRKIGTLIWLLLLAALLIVVLFAVPWGRGEVADQLASRGVGHTAAVATYDALIHQLVIAARIGLVVAGIIGLALLALTVFDRRQKTPATPQ